MQSTVVLGDVMTFMFIRVLLGGCLGVVGDGFGVATGESQKPHPQVSVIFQLLHMTQCNKGSEASGSTCSKIY